MKPRLIRPTASEDAAIAAGIATDPDTAEVSSGEFASLRKASESHPAIVAEYRRGRGKRGPQKAALKERITIRLSPDVVQQFRATGDGWQSRIDAALRDWLKTHSPH